MFKRNLALFVCLMLLILPLNLALAHGGRTDANGGHYDRSTGEYHYHHGYPAHDHPGGVCPYDYDDQTDHSGGTNDDGTTNELPLYPYITPAPSSEYKKLYSGSNRPDFSPPEPSPTPSPWFGADYLNKSYDTIDEVELDPDDLYHRSPRYFDQYYMPYSDGEYPVISPQALLAMDRIKIMRALQDKSLSDYDRGWYEARLDLEDKFLEFYNAGYDCGYDDGLIDGYAYGTVDGEIEGWNIGYGDAIDDYRNGGLDFDYAHDN